METKYTRDGKKVVVIGDLNQTEKIVQEIYVTKDGDELPQGERFVEKNLLDEPTKSWKQANLEGLEKQYETSKNNWNSKIKNLENEKRLVYNSLSARVAWLREVAKEPRDVMFKKVINQLADFLDGSEKWIFTQSYSEWYLEKFNEDRFETNYSSRNFDSMRLLSLYGNSKGDLTYKINDYSDGSGSDKEVVFFKTEDEGLFHMQNKLDNIITYDVYTINSSKKFNLKLNSEKLKIYLDKKREGLEKSI